MSVQDLGGSSEGTFQSYIQNVNNFMDKDTRSKKPKSYLSYKNQKAIFTIFKQR